MGSFQSGHNKYRYKLMLCSKVVYMYEREKDEGASEEKENGWGEGERVGGGGAVNTCSSPPPFPLYHAI